MSKSNSSFMGQIKEKISSVFFSILLLGSRKFGKGFALVFLWPLISLVKALLFSKKKKFIMENIRTAIPDKSPEFYESVMKDSLQNSLNAFFANVSDEVKLDTSKKPIIDDIINSNEKGAIVITTHHGDWEGVFRYFGNLPNCDAGNFYNRPANNAADEFIREVRTSEQFASGEGYTKKIIERFANSDGSKTLFVVIAIDLYVKQGVAIDFLNRKTVFSDGALKMAAQSDVPIIAATSLIKDGETKIDFSRIDYDVEQLKSSNEYAKEILQKVMKIHSDAIISNPEQWLFWPQNFWKKRKK